MRRLLRARLGQRHLRSRPAGGEDRLRGADGRGPERRRLPLNSAPSAVLCTPPIRSAQIDGKYAARATPICAFADDDLLLGRLDVGPPLEQRRRQPGGHVGWLRLIGQRAAARDRRREVRRAGC